MLFFVVFLSGLSFLIAWAVHKLYSNPPFWLDTLSPLGAYIILYSLFENYFWSWKIFKVLGIVNMPDLRGRWHGAQRSSYQENGQHVTIESYLEIEQTFSKICVRAYYEKSESESMVANFAEVNGHQYLYYSYDNDPNSFSVGDMARHKGTAKLHCHSKGLLKGSYFNSIGNSGDMEYTFLELKLAHRFK